MKPAPSRGTLKTALGYFACGALVPLYVNLFPLWKFISNKLGDLSEAFFTFAPVLVLALLLALCWALLQLTRTRLIPLGNKALLVGVVLCIIGLLLPDPAFPVKRIHVAEYAMLSLVARFAMSSSMSGRELLFYSSCFAALLGIHDEFLQGLHPARTYGLQDMTVNALGSCGGGLIWHGLRLFSSGSPFQTAVTQSRIDLLYLSWLAGAVLMLVWPAYLFKGQPIAMWSTLPVLAAVPYFLIYRKQFSSRAAHGITALTAVSAAFVTYPLLSQLPGMVFY